MARASTYTHLSLDRYAMVMGINPVHFNGADGIHLADGRYLFPLYNSQNNIWPQYSWQNADQVSRDDLARIIRQAEEEIELSLTTFTAPDWVIDEEYYIDDNYRPEVNSPQNNVRTGERGIMLKKSSFIAGGVRKVTLIKSASVVTYVDEDLDTWKEVGCISENISSFISSNPYYDYEKIKFYFTGYDGEREWEIRPIKYEYINGLGVLNVKLDSWKLINPVLWEALPTDDQQAIDISGTANFVATIDIYYEENDTTQPSAKFYTSNGDGSWTITDGVLFQPKFDDKFTVIQPATYDAVSKNWLVNNCLGYSKVSLSYYCGYKERKGIKGHLGGFKTNDYLWDILANATAWLTTARLERPYYGNTNATSIAEALRQEYSVTSGEGQYFMGQNVLSNPFGTKNGEVKAWKAIAGINNRHLGVAIL
jgi:hypothetical protein